MKKKNHLKFRVIIEYAIALCFGLAGLALLEIYEVTEYVKNKKHKT